MAGKQRAALEERARSILADAGMQGFAVDDDLRIGRPAAARLEIAAPALAGCLRYERGQRLKAMEPGAAAAVLLELAQITRALRDAGVRATADYVLGCVVVGWGRPPQVTLDDVRQDLADRAGGEPPDGDVVLVAWAGHPRSEADALGGALQQAADAIAPAYRRPGPAGRRAAQRPGPASLRHPF